MTSKSVVNNNFKNNFNNMNTQNTLSEHAQTNDNSNELEELDELDELDQLDELDELDDSHNSDSENSENSLDEQSDNLTNQSNDTNENFNEFALKHLSELLINLLTLEDKNSIVHNNTNFQSLTEKLNDIHSTQKLILKSIEENTKVNKIVMKLLEKGLNYYVNS